MGDRSGAPPAATTADCAATARRLADLERYMARRVLGPAGFCCGSERSCRASVPDGIAFHPGQLSHVGAHYDVSVGATALRVLVVGMDTGRTDEEVTLAARRRQIEGRIAQPFNRRNPHMRGTTLALRALFGLDAWEDPDDEFLDVDGDRVHVFDAYAMANVRLCSAVRPGSTASHGTTTMTRNCLRHLAATVRCLEPNIVVLQGTRIRGSIRPIVTAASTLAPTVERVQVAGVPVLLASFAHPSYPGPRRNWSWPDWPYFTDVVEPALREARRTLLT